jgi:hypothetical protein
MCHGGTDRVDEMTVEGHRLRQKGLHTVSPYRRGRSSSFPQDCGKQHVGLVQLNQFCYNP